MSSASRSSRRRGFTLIEALVAVLILSIGVASLMGGLGAITNTYGRMEEKERMHRLTEEKLDEIIGIGETVQNSEGGFEGIYQDMYDWQSYIDQTGTEGLALVTVTVRSLQSGQEMSASRLVFTPPAVEQGAGGAQPTQ